MTLNCQSKLGIITSRIGFMYMSKRPNYKTTQILQQGSKLIPYPQSLSLRRTILGRCPPDVAELNRRLDQERHKQLQVPLPELQACEHSIVLGIKDGVAQTCSSANISKIQPVMQLCPISSK